MDLSSEPTPAERLALLDWKRRVFSLYAQVRAESDPRSGWERWRAGRDVLFASHSQSPLPAAERARFAGLSYFAYDPALRVSAELVAATPRPVALPSSGSGPIGAGRFARALFVVDELEQALELYWTDGYGGGLLLVCADSTSGSESYGGGRYVLDTVKGADLGSTEGTLVVDFNFAYNPSCCYDPRWLCPLAPPANRLTVPLRGGERAYEPLG